MSPRREQLWTPMDDAALLAGLANRKSRAVIARDIGRSRNAVIARFHRIVGNVFPSDQIRRARRHLRKAGAT